ncbi:N-acetyltransferase [Vibrio zhanjiangensis]|uniref:N-acetyltransferase n=1 Tax=Vibrio zhanjiangensis TaxID=1046128 RepID=A0ABQ6EXS2_9VIBR|nr:GNAT family N-acetyltransferase [Vibrio zhanjiangensis]GLT17995.1 N-acetyltransferase [Vibrio zhanjiangensis]
MENITIRVAQVHDLDQLDELMFRLHDEHHHQCPEHFKTAQEIEQEKSIARYINDPDCLVIVACKDKTLVGFITGYFCELTSSVSKPVPMGSVDELYVVPEMRKCGIATDLYRELEHRFDQYGVKQVFVEVWDFNQVALNLYKDLKFQHHIHWLRKPIG